MPVPTAARVARCLPALALAFAVATSATAAAPWRDSARDPTRLLHGHGCDPARCALQRPSAAELDALLTEAERLLVQHADDLTPLDRQCRLLGATMRDGVDEVRMLPVMWRVPDPDGVLAPVTGDAHPREPAAGVGRVHIARGFDALNPDRGLPAIVATARHEFAHLMGMGRRSRWGRDEGAHLAAHCGAPEPPALPAPPPPLAP